MKNKISDVHNILMAQLESLSDLTNKDGEQLSDAEIDKKFKQAKMVNDTASQIIALNQLAIDAQKLLPPEDRSVPALIEG
ncbi:hypothetical protein [Acinetobacter sp. ANC 4641]|uniref:hypothetical protein n=1 Tax=Acinetobacter sp. ANC 4641 TaxID=2529847 RepID=UPI00103BD886|nr:hypothetical protein [Acinetobacter sp. ANC 4641]TCB12643.1 hypothetical protein E0H78_05505 [Acinetobacter sp. ANC 4641]